MTRYLFDGPECPGCNAPVDVHAAGWRVTDLRTTKRGWSALELAERAGLPEAVVRRVERGSFSLVNMLKIANALGSSLDYILYGEAFIVSRKSEVAFDAFETYEFSHRIAGAHGGGENKSLDAVVSFVGGEARVHFEVKSGPHSL